MASHHFIGNGRISPALDRGARSPDALAGKLASLVREAGLEVVDQRFVEFENGGLTVVCVLAESHLVLHHWSQEGFATLDLHVCDYQGSNAAKAGSLVAALTKFCFEPQTYRWNEIHLPPPAPAAVSAQG